jgi:FkbM family methyltransferase
MFVSYAQNFEDVILYRALKDVSLGFYIDIGAQDPVIDSVSQAFYELGWRGVHIEPNSFYANKLRECRPDEIVLQCAVASQEGVIPFFKIADTGLSTADEGIANQHVAAGFAVERSETSVISLSKLLDLYGTKEVHWLKIDVEGLEQQVIESWLPSKVRPWVVVVESTRPLTSAPSYGSWDAALVALGYEFVYFDGLNRFYLSINHLELKRFFGPGPNIFDEFTLSGVASSFACQRVNDALAKSDDALAKAQDDIKKLSHALDNARKPWKLLFFHKSGKPRSWTKHALIEKLMQASHITSVDRNQKK